MWKQKEQVNFEKQNLKSKKKKEREGNAERGIERKRFSEIIQQIFGTLSVLRKREREKKRVKENENQRNG